MPHAHGSTAAFALPPTSGFTIPGWPDAQGSSVSQQSAAPAMSTRQSGELIAALDQARQQLSALDPKWGRANDAAILDKIMTDRTLFTGSNQIRRLVERLGSIARTLFGPAVIGPEPPAPVQPPRPASPQPPRPAPTPGPRPVQPVQPLPAPPLFAPPFPTAASEGWPTSVTDRVGEGSSAAPFDNPIARFAFESGRDPTTGGPREGYEWAQVRDVQPFSWLSPDQMNPYQRGLYENWERDPYSRDVVPVGTPPGQTWDPALGGYPIIGPPEPEQPPGLQIGQTEVDEDTGIEYRLLGGDGSREEDWEVVG